jgi:hypothetical protein
VSIGPFDNDRLVSIAIALAVAPLSTDLSAWDAREARANCALAINLAYSCAAVAS